MRVANHLDKNKTLKGIYKGRRCFVLGNGPSLKVQDLHPLRGEVTIVTSSFHLHEAAPTVRPEFWLMADPAIWNEPEKHFLPHLRRVKDMGVPTKLFLPTGGIDYFESVNPGHLIDFYFYQYDHNAGINELIDFTRGVPPFGQNVVLVSLMLAFHLGCNPIYFLGCDHDFYKLTQPRK